MTSSLLNAIEPGRRLKAGWVVAAGPRPEVRDRIVSGKLLCLSITILALLCSYCLHASPIAESPASPFIAGDDIFQHLGEGSGLANQVVSDFAQDNDGFMWISSQGGLQRWDGYRLWTYKAQLGVAGALPDNLTHVLHADTKGTIWVGTSSGGLARYDRETDKFIVYRGSTNGAVPVNVLSIEDDGHGGLWIGSGSGIDYLDRTKGDFTHITPTDPGGAAIEIGSVQALLRTADGTLWVGSNKGLFRFVPGARPGQQQAVATERIDLPGNGLAGNGQDAISIHGLFAQGNGTIWVGSDHGIYLLDHATRTATAASLATTHPSDGTATVTAHRPAAAGALPDLLSKCHVTSIKSSTEGDIWVGTQEQGIFVIAPSTWAVRHITHNPTQSSSLADDWIDSLYLSRQGIMWVGSRRGVSYVDTVPKGISTFLGGESSRASLRDDNIYAVLPRRDGTIWLGLSKHGIDILSPNAQKIAEIRSSTESLAPGAAASLPEGTIEGLRDAGNGGVYLITNQGLYRADDADVSPAALQTGTGQLAKNFHPRLKRLTIGAGASDGLYQVVDDHDSAGHEKLWLGGNNGLWTYDPAGNGPAVSARLSKSLTDPRIRVLLPGAGNVLWVGTLNGLNRVDMKTGQVDTIPPNPSDPQGLGAGMISTLLIDRKGRLWVGTFSGGVHVFQGFDSQGKARFRRIIEGLPDYNVDRLLEAGDGRIWASTDNGLAVIDPFNFDVQTLSRAEGAFIHSYWDGVGGKTTDGDLIFGGAGGLTIVRPSLVKQWNYAPPVVVTSARIGLTDVPLSRLNSGLDQYPIWIPADQNNLTVEFAALDYTAPSRNRYEYKLEGFDLDWVTTDPTRRVLRYTNLPPGRYTLLLRGSNRDGVWAPARAIKILVLPTWYQKAWFRIAAFLATLLLLFAVFLIATAYMRRQQRELERQVALRTAELEQKTVELKQSQQKLEHMAYTDSLTGLPNRRMFTEHFRRLLALKRRQQGAFALLLMDFDAFKIINDTYGHDAGDAVLREMARRMSAVVRESDCLARLGGDEYGLILGQSPDAEATAMVCQKIIESFVEPILFQGTKLKTSPSVGVALYPYDGRSQDQLYKAADLALYEAKRAGGNGCAWGPGSAPQVESQQTGALTER